MIFVESCIVFRGWIAYWTSGYLCDQVWGALYVDRNRWFEWSGVSLKCHVERNE